MADIIGVVIATIVLQNIAGHGHFLHNIFLLVCGGTAIGFINGKFLIYLLKKHNLPDILQCTLVLSSVLCSYIVANAISEEAGYCECRYYRNFIGKLETLHRPYFCL